MGFLTIDNITKQYKGAKKPCLENLSLDVEKGEILVFLGPSGCGKTTLLKIIAGLEEQDCGSIVIDGECVDKIPTEKRPISMVFQKPYLFKNMTVEQNISFAPKVTGKFSTKEEMIAETQKYIDLVKLTGFEKRSANQLSGGQEQRVSLARALILKPKLLLLDEPLSALDASLRVEMRSNIREICKELGQTVIFVTHDQEEAAAIGDRIALISGGTIEQYGPASDFYERPKTKRVSDFFGWKNYIPCTLENGIAKSVFGEIKVDCEGSGEKLLTIRPEAIYEDENGQVECKVAEVSYLGTRVEYKLDADGTILSASMEPENIRRPGDTIKISISPNGCWVVDDIDEPEPVIVEEEKKSFFAKIFRKK